MTRPILEVIAHEATRTGSPRVLYDLLRSARGDIPASLSITLLARGSLAERLEALDSAPTGTAPPNAVLLNSCITAEALEAVPPGIPTAVYVHEDSEVIESLPPHTARGVTTADLVAAVSEASAAALVGIGVEPGRIRIVRPICALEPPPAVGAIESARAALAPEGIERVVLACGEAVWRKGPDLFIDLAARLGDHPEVGLAWVGRRLRSIARVLDHDVAHLGLHRRITWLGEVEDPAPYIAAADVLVMTSRRDACPLVPIEAATLGTPTAGFAVGGLADFARADAIRVVPYPDTHALAASVLDLLDGRAAATRLVATAQDRLVPRHRLDAVLPVFIAFVNELLALGDA